MTTTTLTEATSSFPRPFQRYASLAARFALGLVFFASGLMGLLHLLPPPGAPLPAGAVAFGSALLDTRYMFPLIKGTEAIAGALLLANSFAPLALVLLAPVMVNICLFHAFLAPAGVALPLVLAGIELYLAWTYRDAYRPLFVRRARAS
jgi:uncharacterized membrane protein YphA (DoxX/SURF4 family)